MKKIDWYIVRKFLGTFFYAIGLIIIVVIIFDVAEKIDDFIKKEAPLHAIIVDYYLNFIPYFVNMFSALFTFIAVVFFTAKMAQNTEFIALHGAGLSLRRLCIPYMLSALLLGMMNLYLANYLIPKVNVTRTAFETRYIFDPKGSSDINIHLQYDDTTFFYAESINYKDGIGYNFTREVILPEFGLKDKMSAESVRYDSATKTWTLYNYYHRIMLDSIRQKTEELPSVEMKWNLVPGDFQRENFNLQTMNLPQLNTFIARERLRGSTNVKAYEYERYQRFTHPFASIVMTLIALAMGSRKSKNGIGGQLAIGISLAFSFILFLQMSRVFATLSSFPVWLAAWLPIIVFGCAGLILFWRAEK